MTCIKRIVGDSAQGQPMVQWPEFSYGYTVFFFLYVPFPPFLWFKIYMAFCLCIEQHFFQCAIYYMTSPIPKPLLINVESPAQTLRDQSWKSVNNVSFQSLNKHFGDKIIVEITSLMTNKVSMSISCLEQIKCKSEIQLSTYCKQKWHGRTLWNKISAEEDLVLNVKKGDVL